MGVRNSPSTSGARGSDAIAEDKKLVLSWDLVLQGPTNAQALRRTFGQLGEPRVKVRELPPQRKTPDVLQHDVCEELQTL
jgi:hypothetical protein